MVIPPESLNPNSFILQNCLAILAFLFFQMKLNIVLSRSLKNCSTVFLILEFLFDYFYNLYDFIELYLMSILSIPSFFKCGFL